MSCFFLFKQKTAYDMRISDWSSDVCSSDLRAAAQRAAGHSGHVVGGDVDVQHRLALGGRLAGAGRRNGGDGELKRVVSGKRVSVSVDLGGRRIIKKKKN